MKYAGGEDYSFNITVATACSIRSGDLLRDKATQVLHINPAAIDLTLRTLADAGGGAEQPVNLLFRAVHEADLGIPTGSMSVINDREAPLPIDMMVEVAVGGGYESVCENPTLRRTAIERAQGWSKNLPFLVHKGRDKVIKELAVEHKPLLPKSYIQKVAVHELRHVLDRTSVKRTAINDAYRAACDFSLDIFDGHRLGAMAGLLGSIYIAARKLKYNRWLSVGTALSGSVGLVLLHEKLNIIEALQYSIDPIEIRARKAEKLADKTPQIITIH